MKVNALVYLSIFLMLNIIMDSRNFSKEIKQCEKYLAEKSFEKADEAISNAIQINRESPYAWYLKSKVSICLLDYENALEACRNAISIDRKSKYIKLKENIENFIDLQVDDLTVANYPNKIDNMVILTNSKNIQLLSKRKLNNLIYKSILDSIKEEVCKNTFSGENIFSKVKTLSQNFLDLDFIPNSSNSPRRVAGAYGFKRAAIDSNSCNTIQIGSMIHELSHHLLFEIFKNVIGYVYQSQNTDTIEAFSWYSLTNNVYWLLMNEYCAHTVECYYMPLNNYESFNNILGIKQDLDLNKVKMVVELGNSLASDIIYILDGFFTEEVLEEIKMQFLSDRVILMKKGCEFKSDVKLDDEEKFNMINSILKENLINIKINFSYNELNQFKRIFANIGR